MIKKGTMNLLVMLAQLVNIILDDEIQHFFFNFNNKTESRDSSANTQISP